MVPAEVEPASTVIKRFRRMVALFWRCSECRRRFLSIDFDAGRDAQTPRDGVLWLWRAHNTINSQLTTSSRFAKDYPSDLGLGKEPWPLRSLCPRCWRPPVGKGGADEFDEDEVYHFLAARFYASRAATPRPRANAKRNVSSAGPLEDAVLAAAAVDVAGGGVAGSEELHPRRARRLAAIAAIAAVTASAVWALSLRPAASAPPPPAVPAVRRPRRATSAGDALGGSSGGGRLRELEAEGRGSRRRDRVREGGVSGGFAVGPTLFSVRADTSGRPDVPQILDFC